MRHRFFHRSKCRNHCPESCPLKNSLNCYSIYSYKVGDTVRIISIKGARCIRRNLLSIGLLPGTELSILENRTGQTCLVLSENRKITIDHTSACALVVVNS